MAFRCINQSDGTSFNKTTPITGEAWISMDFDHLRPMSRYEFDVAYVNETEVKSTWSPKSSISTELAPQVEGLQIVSQVSDKQL